MVLGDVCDPVSRWMDLGCVDWSAHDQSAISLEGDHYQEDEVSADAGDNQGTQETEAPQPDQWRGASMTHGASGKTKDDFSAVWWIRQVTLTPDLPSSTKLVLMALGVLFDSSGEATPTQDDLAALTSLAPRTVATHLANAEKEGWITRSTTRIDDVNVRYIRAARTQGDTDT